MIHRNPWAAGLLAVLCCAALAACAHLPSLSQLADPLPASEAGDAAKHQVFFGESTVFHELTIRDREDAVEAEGRVYLNGPDARFLCLEMAEGQEATLKLSYTKDKGDVRLTFAAGNGGEAYWDLCPDPVPVSQTESYSIPLAAGVNSFSFSGSDSTCQFDARVQDLDHGLVAYVGDQPRQEAAESFQPMEELPPVEGFSEP